VPEQPIGQIRREFSITVDELGDVESKKAGARIVGPPQQLLVVSIEAPALGRRNRELIPADTQPRSCSLGFQIDEVVRGLDSEGPLPLGALSPFVTSEVKNRMSLLKFSSASQSNTTPAAARSIDHGYRLAARWTHWILWYRESPGAAAPDRAPIRADAADNIQLPDTRRPTRLTDTAGRSPRQ
jgi:hypothetical protein